MKKTEKIEIRVSPEEKEALHSVSQEEGRSASEVLREQAQRYIAASSHREQSQTQEKSMSWKSKIAYIGLGAAISLPVAVFADGGGTPGKPGFEVHVALTEHRAEQEPLFFRGVTRIPLANSNTSIMTLPSASASTYQVVIEMTRQPDKTYSMAFEVCLKSSEGCEIVAKPQLNTAFGSHAELSTRNAKPLDMEIVVVSRPKEGRL